MNDRQIMNVVPAGPSKDFQIAALQAQVRADAEWIKELTQFVRSVANAPVLETRGEESVIDAQLSCYAEELVCYMEGCCNRPTGDTPDNRWFCGEHAAVMD